MLRVTIWPGFRGGDAARPVVLEQPGGRVVAGRTAPLRLPHISGVENEYLSGRAFGVGLDQAGRPYVVNLSTSHELVVRPWGLGTSAEVSLPPRRGEGLLQPRSLDQGASWIRNGRHWDARRARFGSPMGDDRTSWALVEVDHPDPLARLLPPPGDDALAPQGRTVQVLGVPEEWDLSEAQLRSVLVYYSEFLSWPPRVTPRVLTEPAAERNMQGVGGLSRLDHLLTSARRRGFEGDRNDLLSWLVSHRQVTPAILNHAAKMFTLENLLFPIREYRPPD